MTGTRARLSRDFSRAAAAAAAIARGASALAPAKSIGLMKSTSSSADRARAVCTAGFIAVTRRRARRAAGAAFRRARLYSTHHGQDDENQKHEAETAARVVAPARAVRPRRQRADQKDNDHDQQYRTHGLSPFLVDCASAAMLSSGRDAMAPPANFPLAEAAA